MKCASAIVITQNRLFTTEQFTLDNFKILFFSVLHSHNSNNNVKTTSIEQTVISKIIERIVYGSKTFKFV